MDIRCNNNHNIHPSGAERRRIARHKMMLSFYVFIYVLRFVVWLFGCLAVCFCGICACPTEINGITLIKENISRTKRAIAEWWCMVDSGVCLLGV